MLDLIQLTGFLLLAFLAGLRVGLCVWYPYCPEEPYPYGSEYPQYGEYEFDEQELDDPPDQEGKQPAQLEKATEAIPTMASETTNNMKIFLFKICPP